jgi:hypothetical protein
MQHDSAGESFRQSIPAQIPAMRIDDDATGERRATYPRCGCGGTA